MDGLDLESVRCFEAAATHLNFRKAARAVRLSPAAFGQRIAKLEESLRTRLFQRTTRRISLTPAGARALPQAQRLLDEARELQRRVHEPSESIPYELTLGTRFELGISWITPSLSTLASNCPERKVHLAFGDNDDLIRHILRGEVDCAVTSYRLIPAGLTYEPLHDEGYVFVADASVAKPLECASDAGEFTLLDIHPDLPLFRYFLDAREGGETWGFAGVECLGTIASILYRVHEGAGVAVLPRYFVQRELAAGSLVELFPDVELKTDAFRLLWRADHPRREELHGLAAELRAIPLK